MPMQQPCLRPAVQPKLESVSGCAPVTAATATGVFYLGRTVGKRAARKCRVDALGLLSSFDLARLDELTDPIRKRY